LKRKGSIIMNARNRIVLSSCLLLLNLAPSIKAAESQLESIERRIVKEPRYESKPQYLLLALGPEAKTLVWLVEDGRKLYIDRNANGDLTDDGPPLAPTDERQLNIVGAPNSWDFDYVLDKFKPAGRAEQTQFNLARWNYGKQDGDEYGLSFKLDGTTPMYAGWVPFWAPTPKDASIIHFGGPLALRKLRFKEFTVGGQLDRLSFAFMNAGLGKGSDARLSIDALPSEVTPEIRIQWPTKEGEPPLETRHKLALRCCYWEFYTLEFEVPKEAIVGTAKATAVLPFGAMPLELKTNTIEIPVVPATTIVESAR
jgi:hypothetical protein